MQTTTYLDELNDAQRAAVVYNDGPALVIAGAGSGKTRVLVYKLLHLIHSGYDPSKLMALTFTNKAAREMRERISNKAPDAARKIKMGTFHSIFAQILRIHAELLGYTSSFSIYNSSDSKNKVKSIIKLLELDDKYYKPNVVYNRISAAKNRLISSQAYFNSPDLIRADIKANIPKVGEIYAQYDRALRQSNAMDFDDLLFQINVLFRDHPDVLAYWQERIDYLLIDEYQDTNFAQYMIARQLMQDKGAIFVVGDDAQSIYSFRGANLENILGFNKTFPTVKLFKLEQNYRSTQTIVEAAGSLIANNRNQIRKEVFSTGDIGDPIEVYESSSGDLESMWVAKSIDALRRRFAASYADCAVLYRTNAQSRILEQVFRRSGIPLRIYGGNSFFDRKEIMDVLAYLRLLVNVNDDEALLRIVNYPRRGIGEATLLKLREYATLEQISLYEALRQTADGSGISLPKGTLTKLKGFTLLLEDMQRLRATQTDFYDLMQQLIATSGIPSELALDITEEGISRQQNVKELLASIMEYTQNNIEQGEKPTLEGYLNEVSLMTDQDKDDPDDSPSVTAMTVHASKGLEFPHVFIIGLEEKLFPSIRFGEESNIEEERRLFYVALTRAEKTCHIGYARERFLNGRTEYVRPSRFIYELPDSLLRLNRAAQETKAYASRGRGAYGERLREEVELPQNFSSVSFMPTKSLTGSRRVYVGRRDPDQEIVHHQSIGGFEIGARIRHKRFGEGSILTLEGDGDSAMATVCFDTGDTKRLLLRFAKLELL